MADQLGSVETVGEILLDGAEAPVRSFFATEAATRAKYTRNLHAAAEIDLSTGGAANVTMHRVWADLKAKPGVEITHCLKRKSSA